jgi:hypothetical protein
VEIRLEGIVIIVGNYGSGKTEVAVNLAAHHRRAGMQVRIADLDLVNPYFRTREARNTLRAMGIDVVLPPDIYLNADLPILSPLIAGMIRNPSQLTVLDVGGDDVGATVLAALADAFHSSSGRMLQVINPFRPFTDTVDGCLRMRAAIERTSKLTVSGLVGNANLIDETTLEHVYQGSAFMAQVAEAAGLPVVFAAVDRQLLDRLEPARIPCPVLPIVRQLVPPWKKARAMSG